MSRVMDPAAAVDYPYSDGRPMAESEAHLRAMLYLVGALYGHFRDRPDVYVGADMFIYHERGNPAAVVAPDVFVVLGAAKRTQDRRLSYKLWEEPKGPDFVLEVVSRRTWAADRDKKRALYARLGVGEYWLYDPTGERIPVAAACDAPGGGRLPGGCAGGGGAGGTVPAQRGAGARGAGGRGGRAARAQSGDGRYLPHAGGGARGAAGGGGGPSGRKPAGKRPRPVGRAAARRAAEARARREASARTAAEAQVAELRARLRELQGGRTPG